MKVKTAEFIMSNSDPARCPKPVLPEYAFIGRSNVGKSSLINMLVDRRSLAKTSGNPGKTQTINHFLINKSWYLVDLPGYGYAKVSKKLRSGWMESIFSYLENRENLMSLLILIDSRLEPQRIDIDFINELGPMGLPFLLVFTKTDKTRPGQLSKNIQLFRNELLKTWESLPPHIKTSAIDKRGQEELLSYIEKTNKEFLTP